MNRPIVILVTLLLALSACATPNGALTNAATSTAATVASPADACPPPANAYRNTVLGVALGVPAEYLVSEPQYLDDEYTVFLNDPGGDPLLQVALLNETPDQLEALVATDLAQLADLPTERAAVAVGGVEGVMLAPVPGEVAQTQIYLPVDGRLYRLLYAREALDDAGRCLLAGMSFFAPTQTVDDLALGLPSADGVEPPVDDFATWGVHLDAERGFSFRYPAGRWTLTDHADDPYLLSLVHQESASVLHLKVARADEDVDMQLYGGAAGEFVPLGEIVFAGQPVGRAALVYEGVTRAVHYNDTRPIARGDLLFSIALVSVLDYEQGAAIPDDVREEAEQILGTVTP